MTKTQAECDLELAEESANALLGRLREAQREA